LDKLELKGEGFYPAVEKIFADYKKRMPDTNILIVVREGLVSDITSLLDIKDRIVIPVL